MERAAQIRGAVRSKHRKNIILLRSLSIVIIPPMRKIKEPVAFAAGSLCSVCYGLLALRWASQILSRSLLRVLNRLFTPLKSERDHRALHRRNSGEQDRPPIGQDHLVAHVLGQHEDQHSSDRRNQREQAERFAALRQLHIRSLLQQCEDRSDGERRHDGEDQIHQ